MAGDVVRYDVAEGVATVALNSPQTRNALSTQLLEELEVKLRAARDDKAVRCVVLTSTHERVFCAGGDLREFAAPEPLIAKHVGIGRLPAIFTLIGQLGKPTLCAANGHVLAGGLGLALACDLVLAKEGARFGTPEIDVGVFPFMVMALLYRNVPRKRATELLLLGEQVDAHEAVRIGLVNRVLPADGFDAAVADWAARLAAKSPLLMALGKQAIARQQDMALEDALDYLHGQLSITFRSEDMREGIQAFFDKRSPRWSGR